MKYLEKDHRLHRKIDARGVVWIWRHEHAIHSALPGLFLQSASLACFEHRNPCQVTRNTLLLLGTQKGRRSPNTFCSNIQQHTYFFPSSRCHYSFQDCAAENWICQFLWHEEIIQHAATFHRSCCFLCHLPGLPDLHSGTVEG